MAFVTLNGERVGHVVRLNDVDGWVEYYGQNPCVDSESLRTFHRKGVVRVHWANKGG